jgi:DNA-binding NarL/FixJ family response regulator
MTVRVVVAEDNVLLRDGLTRLIEAAPDLELAGTCGTLDDLLALTDKVQPDVVLTDIRMPPTGTDEGIQAAAAIRQSAPDIGVVVLSLEDGSQGRAYLLKDRVAAVDDLLDAIRTVAAGGSVIDSKVVDELVSARRPRQKAPVDFLTPRERETLAEMAQGKSNAAIAAALGLSERAVEKHINSIFSKLNLTEEPDVNRRVRAVLVFLAAQGG